MGFITKKGQITIFIIMGFIILVIVGASIYINQIPKENDVEIEKKTSFQLQTESVKSFVDSCLKQVGSMALFKLGVHGAYIELEGDFFSTLNYDTSYLYYNGNNYLPSLDNIKNQISNYVDENIIDCTNFSIYDSLEIEYGELETSTMIGQSHVSLTLNWPLTIKQLESSREISDFSVDIPVRFMNIYNTVKNVIDGTQKHPGIVDAFLLLDQDVSHIDYTYFDDTIVYLITDNESKLEGHPYYFLFATKIEVIE